MLVLAILQRWGDSWSCCAESSHATLEDDQETHPFNSKCTHIQYMYVYMYIVYMNIKHQIFQPVQLIYNQFQPLTWCQVGACTGPVNVLCIHNVHVYLHVSTRDTPHTHGYTHLHACTHTHTHARMYTRTHKHTCTHMHNIHMQIRDLSVVSALEKRYRQVSCMYMYLTLLC